MRVDCKIGKESTINMQTARRSTMQNNGATNLEGRVLAISGNRDHNRSLYSDSREEILLFL